MADAAVGPYDEMLKSDIADLANASNSPMAGSDHRRNVPKRFVPTEIAWAHFDTYAWRDEAKPGRPKGGEALGLRAVFALCERVIRRLMTAAIRPNFPHFSGHLAATFRVLTGLLATLRDDGRR